MMNGRTPRRTAHRETGLFGMTLDALAARFEQWGHLPYRAKQVFEWAYKQGAACAEQMTNLPKGLRKQLGQEIGLYRSRVLQRRPSSDGTIKLLLGWPDGATSECVLIQEGTRRTACISTQVGCPVACVFCASGLDGLQRQLSASEIVEQAMQVRRLCSESARLSNVVFMGLGEPLANYAATVDALRILNAEWGMGIAARKITISTVGLPTQMRKLAHEGLQITLALSLHAPTDALRRELIPWAEQVTISSLIEAANYFFEQTGREVTVEYILLSGVNDTARHARQLAELAGRMRSHVNLIPYNPVGGLPFERPTARSVQAFLQTLRAKGINSHVRRSRGLDVDAACGQLRRQQRSTHKNRTPTVTE